MANTQSIQDLPLYERLKKVDYLTRELSEHLRQAYLPKLGALRSAAKIFDPAEVSDQHILDRTLAVLEAEEFTDKLYLQLREYLDSITKEMREMLFGNKTDSELPTVSGPIIEIDDLID